MPNPNEVFEIDVPEEAFAVELEPEDTLTKGKYRGTPLRWVPTDYLQYVVREWDLFDPNYDLAEEELERRY